MEVWSCHRPRYITTPIRSKKQGGIDVRWPDFNYHRTVLMLCFRRETKNLRGDVLFIVNVPDTLHGFVVDVDGTGRFRDLVEFILETELGKER